jgi:gluconolactonase
MIVAYLLAASVAAAAAGPPAAIIDLRTDEGIRAVDAQWRYSDARVVEIDFNRPDANGKPNGGAIKTLDIAPHAGTKEFDDSSWEVIGATTLEERRSNGRLAFNWYRLNVRIPDRVSGFETSESTVIFEVTVDDYAEVWVDGELPRELGQSGGSLVAGWNFPNRVVVARGVRPGKRVQLAIFGANGPLSDPPPNYIWIRSARLLFYPGEPRATSRYVPTKIERVDSDLDALVQPGARIEQIAEGFQFTEGPVWTDGSLLFSDPNANRIYRWSEAGGLAVYRERSGYDGSDIADYKQPGSNGLAVDREGRLTINQHGNRRVVRVERDNTLTVLADRFDGKRLNSPNDLVYKSDGSLYFTDPPFGLPKFYDDPGRQLPFYGVFRVADGAVTLLTTDLKGPNGLAFSPDERYLYVDNWDEHAKIVKRYEMQADGTLKNGIVFFDMTAVPGEQALDGMKIDELGNLYVSGPGGLWIISAEGKHLGTIAGPELPANMAWGDEDRRTLYLTARTGLYRIRLNMRGAGTALQAERTMPR